jgi:hypothetical protein
VVKKVNGKRKQVLVLIGLATLLLLSSFPMVSANKPVSITFTETPNPATLVSTRNVGINVMTVLDNTGSMSGAITGTFTSERNLIFHKAVIGPETMTTGHANYQIEGSYDGKSGTIYLQLNYKIVITSPGSPVATGNWNIIGGTDQLSNLHGQGKFTIEYSVIPPIRQFTGQVHFEP